MVGILQNFEKLAERFEPAILVVPGIVCLLLGLLVWLAGLRYVRFLAAVIGAAAAGLATFSLSSGKTVVALITAAPAGLLAALFREFLFAALLAGLVALVVGAAIAPADLHGGNDFTPVGAFGNGSQKIGTSEALTLLNIHTKALIDEVAGTFSNFRLGHWVVLLGTAVVVTTLAILLSRLAVAVCCASLGAGLSLVGMVLLLLYKGAEPVTAITQRGTFYAAIFGAMVLIGAFVQLVLFGRMRPGPAAAKRDSQPQTEQVVHRWRTE
jgi:uncharacterized membrane protein